MNYVDSWELMNGDFSTPNASYYQFGGYDAETGNVWIGGGLSNAVYYLDLAGDLIFRQTNILPQPIFCQSQVCLSLLFMNILLYQY